MKSFVILALAGASLAAPAAAQTVPNWTGFYVGGRIGYVSTPLDSKATVQFDKDLNGQFGDTVTTAAGANAFSPGFCNGDPRSSAAVDGCKTNHDGLDYAVHAGADYQFGRIVVGGLVEYGKSDVESSVTAFSTTPANYYLSREMRGTFGARARVGLDLQGTLPYVTAGVVRAKVRSDFTSSNTANGFATQDSNNKATGYRLGGGFEKRFGPVSLGALYLFTSVKDDDFRVNVTRGTGPATNPFVLTNPAGTQFRRSDDRFKTHAANVTMAYRF
ncbi:MAG: outer membrane beta-barrel protein [Pseudomonadota bacterium]|nr:outer membrane beta-barrel protein [Pseudomonadota bacterium]